MISGLAAALALSTAAGLVIALSLWPEQWQGRFLVPLQLSLAWGVGLGAASCLFFLARSLCPDSGALAAGDGALVVVSALLLWLKRLTAAARGSPATKRNVGWEPGEALTMAAWIALLAFGVVAFTCLTLRQPHGGWDAWAIWNLRARFIYRGGSEWTRAFTPLLAWSHPDYPLLLPASVARSWGYSGTDTMLAPVLIAGGFTFATALFLTGSVALAKTRTQGYLAGLTLLATPFFIRHGALEYADVPLGFFLLGALALLYLHDSQPRKDPGLLALAGGFAALAGWTKNEGLLCFAVISLLRPILYASFRQSRDYLAEFPWYAAGAAPVLATIAYFKIELATANDLVSSATPHLLAERLTDLSRYARILTAFGQALFSLGGWNVSLVVLLAIYGVLIGWAPQREGRRAFLSLVFALALIGAGYCLPYLASPYDLHWHLATSAKRLILQLWPALLFAFFVAIRSPGQA